MLNGVLVQFAPDTTVTVGEQAYQDADQLSTLRARYSDTHLFRRDGEDRILSIPVVENEQPLGDSVSDRQLEDAPWVAASLVLDALLRLFVRMNRSLARPRPLVMLSTRADDMLLSRAWPENVEKPDWLEKRVTYEFSTRNVYPDEGPPAVLLACDVRTRNVIDATCDVLLENGIDVKGRYVQAEVAGGDPRFKPRRRLVGRVRAIQGPRLILDDAAEGIEQIETSEAFLEPRGETLRWMTQQLLRNKASKVLNTLAASASVINAGPDRLRRVRDIFAYLADQPLELVPGIGFKLSPLLREGKTNWQFGSEMMAKPMLVFDAGGGRTDVWSERGLDTNGPYDRQFFTPKQPRITVICQASVQGQVEQFVYKFFEGMPDVAGRKDGVGRKPYAKGFVRRFALEKPHVQTFLAEGAKADEYRAACRSALEFAADSGEPWSLALVQVRFPIK